MQDFAPFTPRTPAVQQLRCTVAQPALKVKKLRGPAGYLQTFSYFYPCIYSDHMICSVVGSSCQGR
jgi:hypothetical protein